MPLSNVFLPAAARYLLFYLYVFLLAEQKDIQKEVKVPLRMITSRWLRKF
jgi:hypothetical protein